MLKWIITNFIIEPLKLLALTLLIITAVAIPVGSMFGVGYIIDTYGDIYLLLVIPWIGLMNIYLKSFTK